MTNQLVRSLSYHKKTVWWVTTRVLLITVVVSALGLAFYPKYEASTKLTLLPSRSEIGFAAARPEVIGVSPAVLLAQTHTEALLSRELAGEVAKILLSENPPELSNGSPLGHIRRVFIAPVLGLGRHLVTFLNTGRWRDAGPEEALAALIQSRVDIRNSPGSLVFEVKVTWENPAMAARIANLLTGQYAQMVMKAGQKEMQVTREYIDTQVAETRASLTALETKIQTYRVNEKVYASSTDLELGMQELSQYLRALNETRVDWEQMDARINTLKPYQAPAALAAIEADRAGLKSRQAAVEKVITDQIAKLDKLPAKEAGLLELYRERLLKERSLSALQDRLLETRIAEASQLGTARIIDRAAPPLYPSSPLLLKNALLSIPAGLLLSIAVIMIREFRGQRLRSARELRVLGRVIGLMPMDGKGAGEGAEEAEPILPVWMGGGRRESTAHAAARHVDHILSQLAGGRKGQRCLFVSLTGGEGTTFLIQRLAEAARKHGLKVLLVDADSERPGLHKAFGKPAGPGFGEWLQRGVGVTGIVKPVNASLDLISAGSARLPFVRSADIAHIKDELQRVSEGYDLVLIDGGALRLQPAATRLAVLADRIVCVFDATTSRFDDVEAVRERLAGIGIPIECVLNKVRHEPDYLFGSTNGHATAAEIEVGGGMSAARV